MPNLLYLLAPIVVFLVFAVSLTLRAAGSPAQPEKAPVAQTPLPPARDMAAFSKTKLQEMLSNIESSPAPEKDVGAMCYMAAFTVTDERFEYVCPVCNQKTIYDLSKKKAGESSDFLGNDLTTARRLIKEIQKYAPAVSLRENNFCAKCYPKRGTPNLGIVIHYDNGTEVTTDNISLNDLQILLVFFSGELSQKFATGDIIPLRNDMPRLKQLLGEPAAPTSSKKK